MYEQVNSVVNDYLINLTTHSEFCEEIQYLKSQLSEIELKVLLIEVFEYGIYM